MLARLIAILLMALTLNALASGFGTSVERVPAPQGTQSASSWAFCDPDAQLPASPTDVNAPADAPPPLTDTLDLSTALDEPALLVPALTWLRPTARHALPSAPEPTQRPDPDLDGLLRPPSIARPPL